MQPATELLSSDLEFSFWANAVLLSALSLIDSRELVAAMPISHSSVHKTLVHIFVGERVWLDFLRTPAAVRRWRLPSAAPPDLQIPELESEWPVLHAEYRSWIDHLPSADSMAEALHIELPDGRVPLLPRWKVLRHVLDHSNFHRGQIVAALRTLDRTPPAINRMDFWLSEQNTRT
jgi:uncharacterized damage-inducible protein DinB